MTELDKQEAAMKSMAAEINYLREERTRLHGILDAIRVLAGSTLGGGET